MVKMLINSKYEHHNQLISFLKNFFCYVLLTCTSYTLLIVHYVLVPLEMPLLFCVYALNQLKEIAQLVRYDLSMILHLFTSYLQLSWNLLAIQKSVLFNSNDVEMYRQKNLDLYNKIKEILKHFHILPLSPREAITGTLIADKVPKLVWNYVPYPTFIFEDTFSSATISEGKIIIKLPATLPVPAVIIKDKESPNYSEIDESSSPPSLDSDDFSDIN